MQRNSLWTRTAKALGKLLAGVVTLPDNPRQAAAQKGWNDYPRFPLF
jgi:hypothetical protein